VWEHRLRGTIPDFLFESPHLEWLDVRCPLPSLPYPCDLYS